MGNANNSATPRRQRSPEHGPVTPLAPGTIRAQLRDRVTWTVALGITLGLASSSVGPWITGGLVETGRFGVQQASNMVTLEQITMGLVMMVLSGTVHLLPKRTLIVAGVVLILVTQLVSYAVDGVVAMGASRAANQSTN